MADSLPLEAQIMRAAKEHFGKAAALLYALEREGIRGYSHSIVSSWALGKSQPPAKVLLAAARLAGISVDEFLYRETEVKTNRERLADLERRVAQLEEDRDGR